ncbi:MAG: HEAT repeat domain-containing protein [Planctomycetes bacterium]|nr:HEAT repeat domain-containing protein [Planctomycetota bacterium]
MTAFTVGLTLILLLDLAFGTRKKAERAQSESTWSDAARALGLQMEHRKRFLRSDSPVLSGKLGAMTVTVTEERPGGPSQPGLVRIVVEVPDLPSELTVGRENLTTPLMKVVTGNDVQTGHPWFDREILIHGGEGEILAILDETTRRQLLRFVTARGGAVGKGRLVLDIGQVIPSTQLLVSSVQEVLELARRLSLAGRSVPGLLRRNAVEDSIADFRRRCLQTLLGAYAGSDDAREACRALAAPEAKGVPAELRFLAAKGLGEEGWERMAALAAARDAEEEVRARGVDHLVACVPAGRLPGLLDRLLEVGCPGVETRAVRALGKLGHAPSFQRLVAAGRRAAPATAAAIAEALAAVGGPAAEAPLLEFLKSADVEVQIAAAGSLGRIGSVHAVEPLLACAPAGAWFAQTSRLRQAAQSAVAAIQSRLAGAEAGRLSVAESGGESGSLALAPEAGAISFAERTVEGREAAAMRDAQPESAGEESGPDTTAESEGRKKGNEPIARRVS